MTIPGSSIVRQVTWLALPVLIEQVLLYLVGLSDTILTGRYLSEEHLAAVTVAGYLLWFMGSLLTVVSVGATVLAWIIPDSTGLQVLRCRVSVRRHSRHPFSYHRRGCRNGRATEHPASGS